MMTASESEDSSVGCTPSESDCSDIEEENVTTTSERPSTVESTTKEEEESAIAARETRLICASKVLVAFVLLLSATCAGIFTFRFTSSQEEEVFRRKFTNNAEELIGVSEQKVLDAFANLVAFSDDLTSLASYGGKTWPFFTHPEFHIRTADYLNVTGASSVSLALTIQEHERKQWVNYTLANKKWIQAAMDFDNQTGSDDIIPMLWKLEENGSVRPDYQPGSMTAMWQTYPASISSSIVNLNIESYPPMIRPKQVADQARRAVLTDLSIGGERDGTDIPSTTVIQPIFRDFEDNADIVGYLFVSIRWDVFFKGILSGETLPIISIITSPCGRTLAFEINGGDVKFDGYEDHHEHDLDDFEIKSLFAEAAIYYPEDKDRNVTHISCPYELHIFPTSKMKNKYCTNLPLYFTFGAVAVFIVTSFAFILYDALVTRRQLKVATTAKLSNQIVQDLFPKEFQDRLFGGDGHEDGAFMKKTAIKMDPKQHSYQGEQKRRHSISFHDDAEMNGPAIYDAAPVANLFPNCTVLECDIAGFTSWSSQREPYQVFNLLETLYREFDAIAERRRVFKVETIGDAYLAVAGLPKPRKDHAVVMARFAHDVLVAFTRLTHELEITLGPDTSELSMRIGLNSGPVTAGVLRGDGLRFQIFGDTVNMAEEMERTSAKNKIHVSEATAELLRQAGKIRWLHPRESKIFLKGKGDVQTYYISPKDGRSTNGSSSNTDETEREDHLHSEDEMNALRRQNNALLGVLGTQGQRTQVVKLPPKIQRLVDWNANVLLRLLKKIEGYRQATSAIKEHVRDRQHFAGPDATVLDEVQEVVKLPKPSTSNQLINVDLDEVELSPEVVRQLHLLVVKIASMYHNNAFHNFEHASHVCMSVVKLLSRVVSSDDLAFGITSDPLAQFAVVLSALIHDLDHPGVPNTTLVNEGTDLAARYKNKSVAEQNSVDLFWNLLMEGSDFAELRSCIYANQAEFYRFRSVIVNVVLATDIMDKDLGALRKARWDKAFHSGSDRLFKKSSRKQEDVHRKATIVLEHMIQASDVSHTMQHWHVYRRWNERFFHEMYTAYSQGRLDKDPSQNWYKGELGFFDFYIIPLAKKLKECGVFGVSSAEYLNYAMANREEWRLEGEEVVRQYVAKYVQSPDQVDADAAVDVPYSDRVDV